MVAHKSLPQLAFGHRCVSKVGFSSGRELNMDKQFLDTAKWAQKIHIHNFVPCCRLCQLKSVQGTRARGHQTWNGDFIFLKSKSQRMRAFSFWVASLRLLLVLSKLLLCYSRCLLCALCKLCMLCMLCMLWMLCALCMLCTLCMLCMLFMHAAHAIHACYVCMHAMYARMLYMHACYVCMHDMHAWYACIICMRA